MPYHQLPSLSVVTDEEAGRRLPPHSLARKMYEACRAQGDSPAEALRKTLTAWRAFWRA